jgi:hypothetical protein
MEVTKHIYVSKTKKKAEVLAAPVMKADEEVFIKTALQMSWSKKSKDQLQLRIQPKLLRRKYIWALMIINPRIARQTLNTFQLKWCPLGLTWQKLQHARCHVKNIDLIENPIDLLLIYR